MVGAANDVRDLEVEIVDRRRELIGRRAVGTQQRQLPEPKRALRVGLADLVRRLAMPHEALALQQRALVPADAEPLEVGDDRLGAARDVPGRVGVVDPQQERAAALVGEVPVRDGAERAAEMQRPGRARREAHADHARTLHGLTATVPAARTSPGGIVPPGLWTRSTRPRFSLHGSLRPSERGGAPSPRAAPRLY